MSDNEIFTRLIGLYNEVKMFSSRADSTIAQCLTGETEEGTPDENGGLRYYSKKEYAVVPDYYSKEPVLDGHVGIVIEDWMLEKDDFWLKQQILDNINEIDYYNSTIENIDGVWRRLNKEFWKSQEPVISHFYDDVRTNLKTGTSRSHRIEWVDENGEFGFKQKYTDNR